MSERIFHKMVKRYADGREICNCGEAYYDKDGQCQCGCSANLICAKYEIVAKMVKEAGINTKGGDKGGVDA